MADIIHAVYADGFEIRGPGGDLIATCEDEDIATQVEMDINMAFTEIAEKHGGKVEFET